MTKKQFLSTALASLMTLNVLGGCTSRTNTDTSSVSGSSSSESIEDTREFHSYTITTIPASIAYYEDGNPIYAVPEGFILMDNKGYKVEIIIPGITYKASEKITEDGIKMYYAPGGGLLSGDMVIVPSRRISIPEEEAKEIINTYLENNKSLKLKCK